jgi:hypothetical protein
LSVTSVVFGQIKKPGNSTEPEKFRSITGLEFDATGLVTGLEASILPD